MKRINVDEYVAEEIRKLTQFQSEYKVQQANMPLNLRAEEEPDVWRVLFSNFKHYGKVV